ncbi:hypothetical protein ACFX1Z_019370 [Malus domestica]
MTARERCLIMERAIYVEEELQEVPVVYQDMWDYMKEIFIGEKIAIFPKKAGTHPGAVAIGLQQPHNHHDTFLLELWSKVRHGSSSPTWAYQET